MRQRQEQTPRQEGRAECSVPSSVRKVFVIPEKFLTEALFDLEERGMIRIGHLEDPSHEGGNGEAPHARTITPEDLKFVAQQGLLKPNQLTECFSRVYQ